MENFENATPIEPAAEETVLRRRTRNAEKPEKDPFETEPFDFEANSIPESPEEEETPDLKTVMPENMCAKCHTLLEDAMVYCPKCGKNRNGDAAPVCKECGASLTGNERFCTLCGKKTPVLSRIRAFDLKSVPAMVKDPKNLKWLIIAGAALLAFIVLILVLSLTGHPKNFKSAFKEYRGNNYVTIASDGTWMTVDTNPDDWDDYSSMEGSSILSKVNKKLGFGSYVRQEMGLTRSADGRQRAENEHYEVSWIYHPDLGIEALYRIK